MQAIVDSQDMTCGNTINRIDSEYQGPIESYWEIRHRGIPSIEFISNARDKSSSVERHERLCRLAWHKMTIVPREAETTTCMFIVSDGGLLGRIEISTCRCGRILHLLLVVPDHGEKKQPIMALHFWLSSDNIKRYVLLSVLFISKLFKLPHTSFGSPFQTWGYQYFIYPPAADSWDGHYLVDHLHFPAHFLHNLGWVDEGLRLNCKIIVPASMSIRTFGTLGRRQAC